MAGSCRPPDEPDGSEEPDEKEHPVKVPLALAVAVSLFALASGPLDFTMKDIDGKDVDLAKTYKGKVVLMVNVASKCGLTPQYEELEKLYEGYKARGLVILGFPANEFGAQEPGTEKEIKEFCTSKYKVTFPMFSKIVVKGEGIHPLYKFLTEKETDPAYAGVIQWNFTKFLVGRDGKLAARFEPKTTPSSKEVVAAIEAALGPAEPKKTEPKK
jgi:glutathione peroxidase